MVADVSFQFFCCTELGLSDTKMLTIKADGKIVFKEGYSVGTIVHAIYSNVTILLSHCIYSILISILGCTYIYSSYFEGRKLENCKLLLRIPL